MSGSIYDKQLGRNIKIPRYITKLMRPPENGIASKRKMSEDYRNTGWRPASKDVWRECRARHELRARPSPVVGGAGGGKPSQAG